MTFQELKFKDEGELFMTTNPFTCVKSTVMPTKGDSDVVFCL